jgi:hypothetical protein
MISAGVAFAARATNLSAMPRINLLPDDGYDPGQDREPLDALPEEALPRAGDPCPGCLGKGRYVGLCTVEDPCRYCNGSGQHEAC